MSKTCGNCGYGMMTCACKLLALGVVAGGVLGGIFGAKEGGWSSGALWGASVAYGIGVAYVLLSEAELIRQRKALAQDPLGGDVEWADRSVAAEQGAALKGNSMVARDARQLLGAWGAGAAGPQVARMAATQMARWMASVAGEALAVWGICFSAGGFGGAQELLMLGTAVMALIPVVALGRLQMAAWESRYVEAKLLAAIGNDTPAAAATTLAADAGKSVEAAVGKLDASTKELGKKMAEAAASAAAALAASVESLLQLQKSVDATLKTVSVTNEFQATLAGLRQHLSEADSLLKEARKPRKIRLVEDPGQG